MVKPSTSVVLILIMLHSGIRTARGQPNPDYPEEGGVIPLKGSTQAVAETVVKTEAPRDPPSQNTEAVTTMDSSPPKECFSGRKNVDRGKITENCNIDVDFDEEQKLATAAASMTLEDFVNENYTCMAFYSSSSFGWQIDRLVLWRLIHGPFALGRFLQPELQTAPDLLHICNYMLLSQYPVIDIRLTVSLLKGCLPEQYQILLPDPEIFTQGLDLMCNFVLNFAEIFRCLWREREAFDVCNGQIKLEPQYNSTEDMVQSYCSNYNILSDCLVQKICNCFATQETAEMIFRKMRPRIC